MSCNYFIYQGNIVITNDTGIALAGATTTQIIFRKPSGAIGAWNATPSGTTLTYTIQTGDTDVKGNWRLQAYVVNGVNKGYGAEVTVRFKLPNN